MLGRIFAALVGVVLMTAALVVAPQTAGAGAEVCNPDGAITDPVAFQWEAAGDHFVGVLEYGEATFTVAGETLTTRAYRQEGGCFSIPGPTMHMEPGNTYVVRFRNLLPYEPASTVHNDFKDPDVTNLHTHGLHISGEGPGDDVTRMFEGRHGGDYVYDIPADHMGGTYWYHAHHHGSTFLQVSTGGFGMIVIDDAGDGIPANVAAMDEHQVIIGYLDTGAAGTGGDQLVSGTLPAGWTVNGEVGGNMTVPPDTWTHWRLLLADRDARMKTVAVDGACEAELLARDGVWRTTAPKDLPTNEIDLTGASRADLAVRCSGAARLSVAGEPVASIAVGGTADAGPHPYAADGTSTWSAQRPSYLRDLRDVSPVDSETIRMGARTVNGDQFDLATPTFTKTADAVQEWTIRGAQNHPFHLHVYHFQPTEACGDFEAGEYYDTIASNCTVRFDLNAATSTPYSGRTIMHCHILEHEDQGAMTWMDVVGGEAPPAYPSGYGYAELYALDGSTPTEPPAAPSDLAASARSSTEIALSWTDQSTDEDGFELQRSTDGTTFTGLVILGAGTTSHEDLGLTADTTYWYRVRATNEAGTSAWSNTASATTPADTGGESPQVASVEVTTINLAKGHKAGQAKVTVVDTSGAPVTGATVTGSFSGTFNESDVTGTTGTDGVATIRTDGSAKGGVDVTFCVTSVAHPSYQDDWAGTTCASA